LTNSWLPSARIKGGETFPEAGCYDPIIPATTQQDRMRVYRRNPIGILPEPARRRINNGIDPPTGGRA